MSMNESSKNTRRILVIDDDPAFRKSTRMILEQEGYEVYSASDAMEGLKTLPVADPALIILDVVMADSQDGYRFAWTLRDDERFKKYRDVPIVMTTVAYGDTLYQFESHPFTEFVPIQDLAPKPLSPDDLLERVARLLN